jgi:hypothetical protein
LVRAPEIRIASSKIVLGISKVVFIRNLKYVFMDKQMIFYGFGAYCYPGVEEIWVQPAGWAAFT